MFSLYGKCLSNFIISYKLGRYSKHLYAFKSPKKCSKNKKVKTKMENESFTSKFTFFDVTNEFFTWNAMS